MFSLYATRKVSPICKISILFEVFPTLGPTLSSACWHIPLGEEDIHKTTFVLPKGKYEWLVMLIGLKDAAFSLLYVMDNILAEFKKA